MLDCSTRLKAGLDDCKGLFQPECCYDSMNFLQTSFTPQKSKVPLKSLKDFEVSQEWGGVGRVFLKHDFS